LLKCQLLCLVKLGDVDVGHGGRGERMGRVY